MVARVDAPKRPNVSNQPVTAMDGAAGIVRQLWRAMNAVERCKSSLLDTLLVEGNSTVSELPASRAYVQPMDVGYQLIS
jgi:hypothetical protein